MDKHHSVKVLYIVGSGRSGSTILDAVLGNHDQMFSTGELKKLWRRYEEHYCSCGQDRRQCAFWESVRKEWTSGTGFDDVDKNLMPVTDKFERFKRWHRLIREKNQPSQTFKTYAQFNLAIFQAVKQLSGKSIIIDSSKAPERAFALSLIPEIDLYVIHLIRDGRGVIWSRKKQVFSKAHPYEKQNTALETTIKWVKSNLVSEYVVRKCKVPSIQLRYEDFIEHPAHALHDIGEMVALDMSSIDEKIKNNTLVTPNHMIGGNRVRFEKSFQLKMDNQWNNKLGVMDKFIFILFAGPLARKYKYELF